MKRRIPIITLSVFLALSFFFLGHFVGSRGTKPAETPLQDFSEGSSSSLPTENANSLTENEEESHSSDVFPTKSFTIPSYDGTEVIQLDNNLPDFSDIGSLTTDYVQFSELDSLGRCGVADGYIGPQSLATEERGSIGMIKPSGWHTIKYDFVDGKYLYNRCHLIAYQLCGVNSDERNLITGTRYLNLNGMLAIEEQVRWYVHDTGNHVLYRVTPWFDGDNLVATGVQIEALSVEDNGHGICFNVFCFNIQPGVVIDYATGDSYAENPADEQQETIDRNIEPTEPDVFVPSDGVTYVLNTNTMRFHRIDCQSVQDMKESNRQEFFGTRQELIEQGYVPCGRCHP